MANVPLEQLPLATTFRDSSLYLTKDGGRVDERGLFETLRSEVLSNVEDLVTNICNLENLLAPKARNETEAAYRARALAALEGATICFPALVGQDQRKFNFDVLRAALTPSLEDIALSQVQSDWAETDPSSPAYIKNKPSSIGVPGITDPQFLSGPRNPTPVSYTHLTLPTKA